MKDVAVLPASVEVWRRVGRVIVLRSKYGRIFGWSKLVEVTVSEQENNG